MSQDTLFQRWRGRFAILLSFTIVSLSMLAHDSTDTATQQRRNIYMKYGFRVQRRNPTLFFVPSLYTIAKGQRNYIGETYGTLSTSNKDKPALLNAQLVSGNISHYRKIMPILSEFLTIQPYSPTLIGQNILSPFHTDNHIFYRYKTNYISKYVRLLHYTPRIENTQLVSGTALINDSTGQILSASLHGEYEMLQFNMMLELDNTGKTVIKSETNTDFRFFGNRILSNFLSYSNCPITLPDSAQMRYQSNCTLMDTLRPVPLTAHEQSVYKMIDSINNRANNDSIPQRNSALHKLRKGAWDFIGDNLLSSIDMGNSRSYIRLSPIFNPFYFAYSPSNGLSYKMRAGAEYQFSERTSISFNPLMGYNFKYKQFFFSAPLRYTFHKEHNTWVEYTWSNGNRITNSSVLKMIEHERMDTIDFSALGLDYFRDNSFKIAFNSGIGKHLNINIATVYHRRAAMQRTLMQLLGKPDVYRSFAPSLTITWMPSASLPIFTANYERAINNVFKSDMIYERWEFDAYYSKKMRRLRMLSARIGGGFYTNRSTNYFVDFENFHATYLPYSWNDDWSGHFQLLNSEWYNASKYYLRSNITYESPLMVISHLPWIGKFTETERIYLNTLIIEHTQPPYMELGYGFTNKICSVALYGNLLNWNIKEVGCKFTMELFRHW